jgi:phage-related protein
VRTLPDIILQEVVKAAQFKRQFYKIVISTTQTLRWTDADRDIYWASFWWKSYGVTFNQITKGKSGEADSMNLTVNNIDRSFSTIALASDIRGAATTIYELWLDSNMDVLGYATEASAPILFPGVLDQMNINQREANITILSEGIKNKIKTPRRNYGPNCPWVFKGTYCAYAGAETWCDHTRSRCNTLSNSTNFGGFGWMPELETRQFYWGTKPANFGLR